ncbi:MAG: glycosyltransferase [Anaerolineae bacterium]|nr:glycosyltransferase [Anaerolineae bacterium]
MRPRFSALYARISHATALLVLPALTVRLWSNLRFLGWAQRQKSPETSRPRISVLVPARDEAESITACVESLAQQGDPRMEIAEIIVLDDHSTDDTGEKLDALARRYPHLTVIHAADADQTPPGWNGKSHACQRLAERAGGEWLLFTDADTEHLPRSIARGVERALALDVDLLSVSPYQRTESWSERLVVPFIVDFLPLIGLNFRAIWRGTADHVAANGQYLLVRAAAYRALGGHAAIATALVDDFALARRFKANGRRIALLNGADMLRCRMYHNAGEVWRGFSKNVLFGLETSSLRRRPAWLALLFAWAYASVFVVPYVHLLSARWRRIAVLELAWMATLRGMAGAFLKRPPLEALTTPAGAWSVMALGVGALYRRWRGQKVTWKGRDYSG